ncbi:MAG TPA: glutamate--tRNA ligase family protein, partial [Magnetospirillaceae bacterium]|nr:glutamate--tRNA ligase family protein [Magnetospirillaceae bacterium]
KSEGRLYAFYETPEELDYKRKRQMARGAPPVYDRAALALSDADKAKLEAEGRRSHWRFKLDETADVAWRDLVRGPCHYHASHLSDPVLIREDGTHLYTLPSVVDDAEMEVTHVIRGEDHVTNTAAQIQLFQALAAPPPNFAHLPLLTGADGQGLSKRLGSLSLGDLREQGLEAMALNSLLAGLGSSNAIHAVAELAELTRTFDIANFGRGTPKFDPDELTHLNARLLHELPLSAVAERLKKLGIEADEAFWQAVRGNLEMLSDAEAWWKICRRPITPVIEDAGFAAQASGLLPAEPWNAETWKSWTQAVQHETGRKGRPLFHPLRLALTGREDGPEWKTLLPLIGRARALARLQGETA